MLLQPQAIDPVDSVEVPRTVSKKTLKPAFDATETLLSELQSIPIIDNAEVVNITVNQYEQKIQNTFNSPSGQQFEVQFKNNAQFDGDEGLTYNVDNKTLTAQNICVTGTSDLNDVSCLRIRSGSPGEILTKLDYYGNVAWCNPSGFLANTLCVGTINCSNVFTNCATNITQLAFDADTATVTSISGGLVKVEVGSSVSAATPTTLGTTYAYNQTGYCNTYVGYCAGNVLNTGTNNIAIGTNSLKNQISNSTGYSNIAIGKDSLSSFVTGFGNIAIGECSLYCFNSPYGTNIAIGHNALKNRNFGGGNVAIGFDSMSESEGNDTSSGANVALGAYSLKYHREGHKNIAIGYNSLYGMVTGYENTIIGSESLCTMQCGSNNVVLGAYGLRSATLSNNNVAIGHRAGVCVTTGENNTIIGSLNGSPSLYCTVLIGAGTCERIKVDDTGLYINNTGLGSAITFRNVYQTIASLTGATGIVVHDFSLGSIFNHTLVANNFTVNITNLNLNDGFVANITLVINQGPVAFMPQALQIGGVAQTIYWVYGTIPIGTISGKDIVNFSITNIGSAYTVFGQSVSYS